jgi:hypothetical protein
MIDSYSQRIDWDSIAKTAQPAMQPDKNGTWVKLVDHVRIVRALEDALHQAQYKIGELGRSWSATTVSYDCQKIQRDIKAVYDRLAPQSETKGEQG